MYIYPGDKKKIIISVVKITLNYDQYINAKNYIGWLSVRRLGGYHMVQN